MTMTWREEDGRRYAVASPAADEGLRGRRLFVADHDGDLEPALEILSGPHAGLQEITATCSGALLGGPGGRAVVGTGATA